MLKSRETSQTFRFGPSFGRSGLRCDEQSASFLFQTTEEDRMDIRRSDRIRISRGRGSPTKKLDLGLPTY